MFQITDIILGSFKKYLPHHRKAKMYKYKHSAIVTHLLRNINIKINHFIWIFLRPIYVLNLNPGNSIVGNGVSPI